MAYPGDPALSQEIRARVLTTFRQTAELAEEGRLQEASLGCDFILKMDPRFEPARKLQERLAAATGAVPAADLVPGAATAPAPQPPPAAPTVEAAPLSLVDELRTVQFSPQDLALTLADEGVDLGALFESPPTAPPPATRGAPAARPAFEAPPAPMASAPSPPQAEPASRIDALLAEGQSAFDEGQYQNAIDAWSRIFLIDLDHQEANRRIEAARKLKAEQERAADEQLHEGIRALEEGRTDAARDILERLVARNPNHLAARDYLAQLPPPSERPALPHESGDLYGDAGAAPLPASFAIEPPAAETPGPPPVPAAAAAAGATPPRGAAISGKGQAKVAREDRRFAWIGAGALVLLLAAGWFLFDNRQRLFPNSQPTPAAGPAASASTIEEATRLHQAGDVEAAITRLRNLPPAHPEKARARELVTEWAAAARTSAVAVDAAPAGDAAAIAAREAERAALLDRARRAYEEREYLRAVRSFRAAEQIAALAGADADLYTDTKRQLLPLAAQIDLFQQREWDRSLSGLWRQHVDDEENRDVRRLLADTLFNLGVEALRAGNKAGAAENFRDLVRIAPDDPLAQRLLLFTERYPGSSQDLIFQILASQLEFRS